MLLGISALLRPPPLSGAAVSPWRGQSRVSSGRAPQQEERAARGGLLCQMEAEPGRRLDASPLQQGCPSDWPRELLPGRPCESAASGQAGGPGRTGSVRPLNVPGRSCSGSGSGRASEAVGKAPRREQLPALRLCPSARRPRQARTCPAARLEAGPVRAAARHARWRRPACGKAASGAVAAFSRRAWEGVRSSGGCKEPLPPLLNPPGCGSRAGGVRRLPAFGTRRSRERLPHLRPLRCRVRPKERRICSRGGGGGQRGGSGAAGQARTRGRKEGGRNLGESQAAPEPGVPGCFRRSRCHPGRHLQMPKVSVPL